jgi:predicted nucleic-acid-binding Zn-ribbon protein
MDKSDDDTKADNPAEALPVPESTDIKLSVEEANHITDFINSKAAAPHDECTVCGSPLNFVSEYVWKMETQKVGPTLGGRFQSLIATSCHNCGYVRFFNRNLIEWIERQPVVDDGEVVDGD